MPSSHSSVFSTNFTFPSRTNLRTHSCRQQFFASNHTYTRTRSLTIVHSPHNSKSWSSNFIKGLPAGDDFPQNDTPAKHITLLTIIATCKYRIQSNILIYFKKKNGCLTQVSDKGISLWHTEVERKDVSVKTQELWSHHHFCRETDTREHFFLNKEQLPCCLITGIIIIAELKCKTHTYCYAAVLRLMQIGCKEFTVRARMSCLIVLESCNHLQKEDNDLGLIHLSSWPKSQEHVSLSRNTLGFWLNETISTLCLWRFSSKSW